jgi:hypothetical protein
MNEILFTFWKIWDYIKIYFESEDYKKKRKL